MTCKRPACPGNPRGTWYASRRLEARVEAAARIVLERDEGWYRTSLWGDQNLEELELAIAELADVDEDLAGEAPRRRRPAPARPKRALRRPVQMLLFEPRDRGRRKGP